MNNKVFLNGEYLPLSEAKISVLDRGFLFGDGVYEVIPCYSGHLFRLQDHLRRLQTSLSRIRLDFYYDMDKWLQLLTPLINSNKNQYIYLQITRGVTSGRDHSFPENTVPTVFAMCFDLKPIDCAQTGVKALTMEDSRWEMCHVKATTLLANVLLRQNAIEQGCAEAILHKNGTITEGAASNLFVLINGVLLTPENTMGILPGITRQVVLELAENNNIHYREESFSTEILKTASEIWITSSIREILPVVELDSEPVGNGRPGALWHKMNQLFQQYKKSI